MRDKYTFKQVDDERTSVAAICIFHLWSLSAKTNSGIYAATNNDGILGGIPCFLSYLNRLLFKN